MKSRRGDQFSMQTTDDFVFCQHGRDLRGTRVKVEGQSPRAILVVIGVSQVRLAAVCHVAHLGLDVSSTVK
jgi:hypothetical protein